MKNILIKGSVAIASGLIMFSLALPALAAVGNTPPPTFGGSQGKGASTVKYKTTYNDPYFGSGVSCSGARVVNKNYRQDSFTCTIAQPSQADGTYTLANFGGWISDYDAHWANSVSITVATDPITGVTTETGVAYY